MALDLGDVVVASGAEAAGLKLSSPPGFFGQLGGAGASPVFLPLEPRLAEEAPGARISGKALGPQVLEFVGRLRLPARRPRPLFSPLGATLRLGSGPLSGESCAGRMGFWPSLAGFSLILVQCWYSTGTVLIQYRYSTGTLLVQYW